MNTDQLNPINVNLADYEYAGEGANGASYNSKTDNSIMMKLYTDRADIDKVASELIVAQKVYKIGIPSPLPGELVKTDNRYGIRFHRIQNKISYARAIGNHPEEVEKWAVKFSDMCKQLHGTKVDTAMFDNVKDRYLSMLSDNPYYNTKEKTEIAALINSAPDTTTALHGDLQFGNVVTDGERDYFIDLGDFCYGYSMFDLGMVYITCCVNEESFTKSAFHMSTESAHRFWEIFAENYFGPDRSLRSVEQDVKPFAGIKSLIIERDCKTVMPQFHHLLGL